MDRAPYEDWLALSKVLPFTARPAAQEGMFDFEFYGSTPGAWLGGSPASLKVLLSEEQWQAVNLTLYEAYHHCKQQEWSGQVINGERRWISLRVKGGPDGLSGVISDLTQAVTLQQRLRTLWENARIFSTFVNALSFVVAFSPSGSRRFLYTSLSDLDNPEMSFEESEAFTEAFLSRVHPEDKQSLEESLHSAVSCTGPWWWEGRFEFPVMGYRWVQGKGQCSPGPQDTVLLKGAVLDVTSLREGEAQKRDVQDQIKSMVKNMPGILYQCALDEHWTIHFVSDGIKELTGYPADDFLNNKLRGFNDVIHPDDQQMVYEQVVQAVRDHRSYTLAYRIIHKDGQVYWVSEKGRAIRDRFGNVKWLEGAIVDSTGHRRLEEALFQAQKMESLGIMAGGVAHDFNNLLVSIMGFSELARLALNDQIKAEHYLESSIKASRQAAELCKQMLAYAGRGEFQPKAVDINARVLDIVHLLKAGVHQDIALNFDLAGELPKVKADPSQLDQIIMNLILNASDAHEGNPGEIHIQTLFTPLSREELDRNQTGQVLPEGAYVQFKVRDAGKGMDEQTAARIFDPFFTTKPTGRGLGLASVLGILKFHGAGVWLETAPGKGAAFTVLLPCDGQPQKKRDESGGSAADRKKPLVLVVDDEPQVREVAAEALRQAGYAVLEAKAGQDAVALFQNKRTELSAVVMDINMPGMSGLVVLKVFRAASAELPVLVTSGFHVREHLGEFASDPKVAFQAKPFTPSQLINRLSEWLGEA